MHRPRTGPQILHEREEIRLSTYAELRKVEKLRSFRKLWVEKEHTRFSRNTYRRYSPPNNTGFGKVLSGEQKDAPEYMMGIEDAG